MKIKFLGTGSSVPSLRRLSSSYLVLTRSANVLIDVGPSVVRRLLEYGSVPDDVDIVVLTHFHPDHTVDLATFLFACSYGEEERRKPLTMIGGKGIGLFYRRLSGLFPWVRPKNYPMMVKSLSKGRWHGPGFSISTVPMNHRRESIAVRIEERGKTTVFSGDTDYSSDLICFAAGTDLLVLECTFPERKDEGHLNLAAARSIVEQAAPSQAILTHLSPEWEAFDHPLPPPLLLGEDGMEIEL